MPFLSNLSFKFQRDDKFAWDTKMDKAFCEMVSKHLKMYWPKEENEEKLICHIITWKPLISYFVRFCKSLNLFILTNLRILHFTMSELYSLQEITLAVFLPY